MLNINTVKGIAAEAIYAQNEKNIAIATDYIENVIDPEIMGSASIGKSAMTHNFSVSARDVVKIIEKMLNANGYKAEARQTTTRTICMLISWED